jgi:hexokinase
VGKNISVPLKDPSGSYDLTAAPTDAIQLFDFIAARLAGIAKGSQAYDLGHTFSFPCAQKDINTAFLLNWTKEIQTQNVEGQNVTKLLQEAMARQGLNHIHCRAVINDTVGTLLTAAYLDPCADIGSICGTGHNTCYLEPLSPLTGRPMIINLESGNFDKLPVTSYDRILDQESEKKGQQRLEKMASGRYLGELVRIIFLDLSQRHAGLLPSHLFSAPYSLDTRDLSFILADNTPDLAKIKQWLAVYWKTDIPLEIRRMLKEVCSLVTARSAQLVAATYVGILLKIDPTLKNRHIIAIDGSLYEKMPGYADTIRQTLDTVLESKNTLVSIQLTKDGSGIGAAIAAAAARK